MRGIIYAALKESVYGALIMPQLHFPLVTLRSARKEEQIVSMRSVSVKASRVSSYSALLRSVVISASVKHQHLEAAPAPVSYKHIPIW